MFSPDTIVLIKLKPKLNDNVIIVLSGKRLSTMFSAAFRVALTKSTAGRSTAPEG